MERTLLDVVSFFERSVADEDAAARPGCLQGLDPRAKLAGAAIALVAVLLARSPAELAAVYALALALAAASSVRLSSFMKRTLAFVPLFSLFMAVPAAFSAVTPGDAVASFGAFGISLEVTAQGLEAASRFVLRVTDSVTVAVLVVLTTRSPVLLKALRSFGVPRIFTMTLGMAYRYVHLLLGTVKDAFLAVRSRAGFVTSTRTGRRVIGANMGLLWLKSIRLQGQVYDAMVSRGFSGEPKALEDFRFRPVDIAFPAAALALLGGTLWLNHCMN